MKKLIALFSLALVFAFLTGCETTGDPNSGGIFWSESKAKQRLSERQAYLNSLESDTARRRR